MPAQQARREWRGRARRDRRGRRGGGRTERRPAMIRGRTISLGDTPGAGDPEPNLAADLGDKTGAGGAKPSIADDDEVVLTFLGDKTGAGGGDPNQARAVAEAEQAQFAAAMAQGDAEMTLLVRKQQELLAGHRRQQRILDGIDYLAKLSLANNASLR